MATPKNGFVPCRSLTGTRPLTKTFKVKADANNAFGIGDPVFYNNDGTVSPVTAAVSGNFAGVITAVYKTNSANEKIALTFNQPSTGPYLVTGQAGFADVIIDSNKTFVAQIDVSASAGLIGNTVHVSAGAPNNATGISTYSLKGSTLGTDAERPFKIIGIAPAEQITGKWSDKPANSGVEVKLVSTVFSQTTGV